MEENDKKEEFAEVKAEDLKSVSGGCGTPGFTCYFCKQEMNYDARHHCTRNTCGQQELLLACDDCYEANKNSEYYHWLC